MSTFKEFNLFAEIQRAIDELGFEQPTEIQKKSIPLLLSSKKIDFHGQAQTGTGKTFAFGIPLLHRIDIANKVPQALIVAPTRELAVQIFESIQKIAKYMNIKIAVIYGGVSMEDQISTLRRGVHIVVGTPGRLNDHLRRKTLVLSGVRTLVLDEADIMLDMGFKEEIDEILVKVPKTREIWLFSATVKSGISDIMKSHMDQPVSVVVSSKNTGPQKTKQYYCTVQFRYRLHAVTRFIQAAPDFYGFIFCQTKILASEVADQLTKKGYSVAAIHGDLSQAQRNIVIKKFKNQDFTILVATDVAARGIDVANLTHVINYSIPEDLESYVHRVGRTGRAGKEGTAITFISKSEQRIIGQIERKFNLKIEPIDIPSKNVLVDVRVAQAAEYLETLKTIEKPDNEALVNLIDSLTAKDLKSVTAKLLYDKFLSSLDLEEIPYTPVEHEADQLQEIYISVGSDDGITIDDIRDFVMQTGLIKEDQIKTIKTIKRRSFVKLAADCSPELLHALRGKLLKGQRVSVNLTCIINDRDGGSRGGRGRGGDRGGDRGGRGQESGYRRSRYGGGGRSRR